MIITETKSSWHREIGAFAASLRAARLSPQTVRLRVYHLRRFAAASRTASPWNLTTEDLLVWIGRPGWSNETARSVQTSLRKFWSWGVSTGRTKTDVASSLPRIAIPPPMPRPAAPSVVRKTLEAGDARVVLIMRLANELGMRRGEVAVVHPGRDLIRTGQGWSLMVHGKGARKRVLPLPDDLAQIILTAPPGYLFPGRTNGHLSPQWVGTLVSGALADGTTMHQLRHLCATEIHDQTHDLRLVQTLLGHASLATTQRYVAVDDSKIREALATRSRRWQGS